MELQKESLFYYMDFPIKKIPIHLLNTLSLGEYFNLLSESEFMSLTFIEWISYMPISIQNFLGCPLEFIKKFHKMPSYLKDSYTYNFLCKFIDSFCDPFGEEIIKKLKIFNIHKEPLSRTLGKYKFPRYIAFVFMSLSEEFSTSLWWLSLILRIQRCMNNLPSQEIIILKKLLPSSTSTTTSSSSHSIHSSPPPPPPLFNKGILCFEESEEKGNIKDINLQYINISNSTLLYWAGLDQPLKYKNEYKLIWYLFYKPQQRKLTYL